MPNQIDTRRMIPVKPRLHTLLKEEAKEMNKTLNDYIFFLREHYKEGTPTQRWMYQELKSLAKKAHLGHGNALRELAEKFKGNNK